MAVLKNDAIRFEVNDQACVTWLEDLRKGSGNLIVDPKPIYRLNMHTGTNYEDMAFAEDQKPVVEEKDGAIVITVNELKGRKAVAAVKVEMKITLENDHLYFTAVIDNQSQSVVSEIFYPCIGALNQLGNGKSMDLLWPNQLGEKVMNIEKHLQNMRGREALYTLRANYPGPLSMSWMMLTDDTTCMYFCNEDALLHVSSLRAVGSKEGGVSLEEDKFCFVKPGTTFNVPRTVVRLYDGTWREGADEYAAYAGTWRKHVEVQDWMKKMNGYFLVINKQQYGDEMWPYETIPELYELAKAHGYDVLGLFGWYHTGHDNTYPDLEVSPTMGGAEGLKAGIDKVHEQGGHVTLYYQGHLMDVNSKWYNEHGKKYEGRTLYNNPYYEFYPKACNSDFARSFSRRVFSTICPSCPEWYELMKERIDWIASLGADGALYDQIGGMPPYPCFNEEHPHVNGNPALSYTQGRLKLHTAIQTRVKAHKDFAFMSEHVTDAYSQYLDCMHGIGSYPTAQISEVPEEAKANDYVSKSTFGVGEGAGSGNPAGIRMNPQMFRYCFPESMVTVRNPNPYMDERCVSYAFVFGCKFEMELRYLTDQQDIRADAEPEKRKYAKAVADLRREYEKYLLLGTFRAEEGIENPYRTLFAERFTAEDGTSVLALWNDSKEERKIDIKIADKAVCWKTISAQGEGMPEVLAPGEIAVVELA